jgi:hypothetical protein
MMGTAIILCALVLAAPTPATAHRLDEYLQATTIAVEREHIRIEMRLVPGVEVFPLVFAEIDRDRDGVASEAEQQAYARRVVVDLSLAADGTRMPLDLVGWQFPSQELLRSGRGAIELRLEAPVYGKAGHRKLTFENHHQRRISSYLVNGLVPRDPTITVTSQQRSYDQSLYHLEYSGTPERAPPFGSWLGPWEGTAGALMALVISLVLLVRRVRRRPVA